MNWEKFIIWLASWDASSIAIVSGLFVLGLCGFLTFYSWLYRDPVTGEFTIWYRGLISGAVLTAAGLIHRHYENKPLI